MALSPHTLFRQPFVALFFALVAGVSLGAALWLPTLCFSLLALVAVPRAARAWAHHRVNRTRGLSLFMVLSLLMAVFGYCSYVRRLASVTLPAEARGGHVVLSGVVLAVSETSTGGQQLIVRAGQGSVVLYSSEQEFSVCDHVEAAGILQPFPGQTNPGGFDTRFYWARRGVAGQLRPDDAGQVRTVAHSCPGVRFLAARAVSVVRGRILQSLQLGLHAPLDGVARGLLLGDRAAVPGEVADAFTAAGMVHVLAVSGLHVGFVAALAQTAVRGAGGMSGAGLAAALLPVVCFVLVAGSPASAVRAALMLALGQLSIPLMAPQSRFNFLAAAAALLVSANPLYLFDAGFQLSMGATAGIMAWAGPLQRRLADASAADAGGGWEALARGGPLTGVLRRGLELLCVTGAAQLGTLPVMAYHFHRVSIAGFVANPVLVPFVGKLFVLLLGGLCAGLVHPLLSLPFMWLGRPLLRMAVGAVTLVSRIPGSTIRVPEMPGLIVLFYYAGIMVLLSEPGGQEWGALKGLLTRVAGRRTLAVLLSATCLFWYLSPPAGEGRLAVVFLDVGQGDAALVRTPCGTTVVVDTGLRDPDSGYDNGRSVVLPALYALGWLPVNWLLISHLHDDHTGGALALLRAGLVKRLALPVAGTGVEEQQELLSELLEGARDNGTRVELWSQGLRIDLGCGVCAHVLYPPAGLIPEGNANHHSMVVRLEYRRFSVLFTGDIEEPGEQELLRNAAAGPRQYGLSSTVLKVAHHGSATSSTPELLGEVRPNIAVVSVGPNPYGLPAALVLDRLLATGALVLRTDRAGAVLVTTDGSELQATTWTDGN